MMEGGWGATGGWGPSWLRPWSCWAPRGVYVAAGSPGRMVLFSLPGVSRWAAWRSLWSGMRSGAHGRCVGVESGVGQGCRWGSGVESRWWLSREGARRGGLLEAVPTCAPF